jgi:hypothetical protein
MSGPLWLEYPERYNRCDRCRGTGEIDCPSCEGRGGVVGPDYYMYAGTIGRRFGLKHCRTCLGRGKLSCGICNSGSIRSTTISKP